MARKKSIFKLIVIAYHNDNHQYPEFNVFRDTIGCFSSNDKAVQAMNKYEETYDKSHHHSIYAFVIEEFASKEKAEIAEWEDRLSYFPDDIALLLDVNILSKKFEKGDFVEVLRENTVTLEIVSEIPNTDLIGENGVYCCVSPFCEKITKDDFKSNAEGTTILGVWLDCGNPCYRTITDKGKLSPTKRADMFIPRFPVSDGLQNELREKILKNNNYLCKKN